MFSEKTKPHLQMEHAECIIRSVESFSSFCSDSCFQNNENTLLRAENQLRWFWWGCHQDVSLGKLFGPSSREETTGQTEESVERLYTLAWEWLGIHQSSPLKKLPSSHDFEELKMDEWTKIWGNISQWHWCFPDFFLESFLLIFQIPKLKILRSN